MRRGPHSAQQRSIFQSSHLGATVAVALFFALPAAAQDWGTEDDWSNPPPSTPADAYESDDSNSSRYGDANPAVSAWSIRAGLGFTQDPDNFLMNFEIPYAFDQYVSAGPMVQVGIEDDRLLIAPTANLTVTIPDLPGNDFDRFHPSIFVGLGFALIENDDRGGDTRSAGFLVNTGFGLDFELSPRVAFGTRMLFNFLPEQTLEEKFFYSWEVLGVKLTF